MEMGNFLTWAGAIALIAGFAIGVMRWAYVGSGSVAVTFDQPVSCKDKPDESVSQAFQEGCEAFRQGKFRRSLDRFGNALKSSDTFAEAHHNRGLVLANLRQDNDAVLSLVKAGALYLEQGNPEGYALVKQHLEQLKQAR